MPIHPWYNSITNHGRGLIMETIVKQILANMLPVLIQYMLDNRQILIDYLKEQAADTNTPIDDYAVGMIEKWINSL